MDGLARFKRKGVSHLIGVGLVLVVVGLFAAAVLFVSLVLILLGVNIGGGYVSCYSHRQRAWLFMARVGLLNKLFAR